MSKVIRSSFNPVDVDEAVRIIETYGIQRRITSNHMHHTAGSHAHCEKVGPVRVAAGIYVWHTGINPKTGLSIGPKYTTKGKLRHRDFSDFAQHHLVYPDGSVLICRDMNVRPASARGHNGVRREGPYMIEAVGDFRDGKDPFDGAQRESCEKLFAAVAKRHDFPAIQTFGHKEMQPTACPGDFDLNAFRMAIHARVHPDEEAMDGTPQHQIIDKEDAPGLWRHRPAQGWQAERILLVPVRRGRPLDRLSLRRYSSGVRRKLRLSSL